MFVATKTKKAVIAYLARQEVGEILARKTTQASLRESLVLARRVTEQRLQSNQISQELISQRVSV